MADTTFVDNTTVIEASWLNAINDFYYTLFNGTSTASGARTALGLGTIATQDSNSVTITGGNVTANVTTSNANITGGTVAGITDITVADGGTGASTAAGARTNLAAQEDVITTRGDLVRGSSGAVAERLALGSTGQVLESDGTDAAWATLDEWTFQTQYTASASAAIDIIVPAASDSLFMIRNILPETDGASLYIRTAPDETPTIDSGASDYRSSIATATSATTTVSAAVVSDGTFISVGNNVGNVGTYEKGLSGEVVVFNPRDAADATRFQLRTQQNDSTGAVDNNFGGGIRLSVAAVQTVRFLFSSGNITSGTIDHYTRPVQ